MNKNILAIDASTEALSVALIKENGVICNHFEVCPQEHSQKILPKVEEILTESKLSLSELDVIAFGRGPGSFTGVRISVAITQGLAYSANKPVIGISTLQTMAQEAIELSGECEVLCAIDARMGEIYFAHYKKSDTGYATLVGKEVVVKPALIEIPKHDMVAVGTGWQTYPELLETNKNIRFIEEVILPNAKYMLGIATQELDLGKAVDAKSAEPVYVRNTVTWKKLPGRE